MIELKGLTIPVVIIKIKERKPLQSLKEEIKEKLSGPLLKWGYFLIDSDSLLTREEIDELEDFLHTMNLNSVTAIEKRETSREERRLLIVDRCLRSGQKVEHNGDVLVLGDVNRDAEVVATGNIIVTGTLRGIARAGVMGDEDAVVVAYRMEPQRIEIGLRMAILMDSDKTSPGYPEVARVEDGKIVLDRV